jgi:hypothetical protein
MVRHQAMPGSYSVREENPDRPNEGDSPKNDPIVDKLYPDGPSLIAHKLYAKGDPKAKQKPTGPDDAETLF